MSVVPDGTPTARRVCGSCRCVCPFHFLEEMRPPCGSSVRVRREAPGGLSLGGGSHLKPLPLRAGRAVQAAVTRDASAGTGFVFAVGSVLRLCAPRMGFTCLVSGKKLQTPLIFHRLEIKRLPTSCACAGLGPFSDGRGIGHLVRQLLRPCVVDDENSCP